MAIVNTAQNYFTKMYQAHTPDVPISYTNNIIVITKFMTLG